MPAEKRSSAATTRSPAAKKQKRTLAEWIDAKRSSAAAADSPPAKKHRRTLKDFGNVRDLVAALENGEFAPAGVALRGKGATLSDADAQLLGDGVAASKTLEELVIDEAILTEAGAVAIAEGVGRSQSLEALSVIFCQLSDAGAAALARAVARSETLAEVDIGCNVFEDEGAKAFAEVVAAKGSVVRSLCLDGNFVGTAGATALASAACFSPALRFLDLRGNTLTDEAVPALAGAVHVLEGLRLVGTELSAAARAKLGRAAERSLTMKKLELGSDAE